MEEGNRAEAMGAAEGFIAAAENDELGWIRALASGLRDYATSGTWNADLSPGSADFGKCLEHVVEKGAAGPPAGARRVLPHAPCCGLPVRRAPLAFFFSLSPPARPPRATLPLRSERRHVCAAAELPREAPLGRGQRPH